MKILSLLAQADRFGLPRFKFDELPQFSQGSFLEFLARKTHNSLVKYRAPFAAYILVTICMLMTGTVYASQSATNYSIPLDVIDAGGADVSKSSNYLLSDSIGEPVVGYGASTNYVLNSGYRQPSASEFLSLSCANLVQIGSVNGVGQQTGSGTCTVYSDAYNGYNLGWAVLTGSGGTNTGYLISQYNDTIAPYTPAVANTPETWNVGVSASEWGGRVRSASTDTASEWGTDGATDAWLNVATTNRTIVTRSSATPLSGSVEILQFRAEVGGSYVQPSGTYLAVVTMTLVQY